MTFHHLRFSSSRSDLRSLPCNRLTRCDDLHFTWKTLIVVRILQVRLREMQPSSCCLVFWEYRRPTRSKKHTFNRTAASMYRCHPANRLAVLIVGRIGCIFVLSRSQSDREKDGKRRVPQLLVSCGFPDSAETLRHRLSQVSLVALRLFRHDNSSSCSSMPSRMNALHIRNQTEPADTGK